MARKSGPTIQQEELYPLTEEQPREAVDDGRLLDLEVEQESRFLRGQKRVSVRKSTIPKKAASRLKWAVLAVLLLGATAVAGGFVYRYGERSWRFRIESSDNIEISGIHNVAHSQIMEVMGGDIGRNIFFVPLAQRRAQLEQIPWVESASVMRFIPNRLKVEIRERVPVAFARVGTKILLIDAGGTLMDLPTSGKTRHSFPVILGMNPSEPLSTRAPRMQLYGRLIQELDSDGGHYSQELSEVDLSDPDDVKVLTTDPDGEVLVHLGSAKFLERYRIYVTRVKGWRQQFDKLESVDLRYDRQIIVNPDLHGAPRTPPLSAAAARAAMAAGVKPAVLITHITPAAKPNPAPAVVEAAKKTVKPADKKAKPAARRAKKRAAKAARTAQKKTAAAAVQQAAQKQAIPAHAASGKPSPSIAKKEDHP